jgi:biotin transport system substrate-specific component
MQPTHSTTFTAPAVPFQSTVGGRVTLAIAASLFVALCAHVSIPLPFTEVPLTLQPFAVILTGLILGPIGGFSAMMLYLVEGASGLPVFTPQGPGGILQLLGFTGGFLFAYPLVAAIAGAFAQTLARPASSRAVRFTAALAGGIVATALLFTMGFGWLAHLKHLSLAATLRLALLPFLPGEIVKIVAAAGIFAALPSRRRA